MTDRHTADSITSDALDQLYERVATAEQEANTAVAAAAHLTTLVGKRSEKAERAAKGQRSRADIAERELRALRAGLRANGADPTQIQNLWAQISLRTRQWREAKRELRVTRSMLAEEGGDVSLVDEMIATVAKAEGEARQAQAAIARVRKACDSVQAADQGHTPAVDWVVMRVLEAIDARLVPASGPAATQATEAARDEAIRQLDADPHGLNTGMIVKPYTDHGLQRWVFRCWGTSTCDGRLSLDHTSQQSAERARDRHVTEEH